MAGMSSYRERTRPHLPRPNCRVMLVCGPPASGKSTYVNERKGPLDIVIDLDLIAREKGFGRSRPASAIGPLLEERNRRLAMLSLEAKTRIAWVIVSAPGAGLRRWWMNTLGVSRDDLILLVPPREELRRRIENDPDRRAVQSMHFGLVDKWFAREDENKNQVSHQGEVNDWYKSYRWKQRRLAQLREHPLCARCSKKGLVAVATIVDHIEPHKGNWNSFWLNKLQSLCKACHDSAKRYEELRGYDNTIGSDGWPVDPRHPTYQTGR